MKARSALRWLLPIAVLFACALGAWAQTNEDCEACHDDPGLTKVRNGQTVSLTMNSKILAGSVHKGLQCVGCHRDAAVEEFPHPETLGKVSCAPCHQSEQDAFDSGIHGKALKRGAPYAPTCAECHGTHTILPPADPRSNTYKMKIPFLCGQCHREGAPVARVYQIPEKDILTNYSESIHGEALFKKGLIVTATCNDCHGNHAILPHTSMDSTISIRHVAQTCTRCHARIEEVHVKVIKGSLWEEKPGAIPACTDCHRPHTIRKGNLVQGTADRECLRCHEKADIHKVQDGQTVPLTVVKDEIQESVHRDIACVKCHSDVDPRRHRPCETAGRVDCSSCHAQVAEEYFESDHGQGYVQKTPKSPYCTDCHGKHGT
jgi:predicted CXXCH cytochrome family protein